MTAANSLNISEVGFQSFDGINLFKGRTLTAGAGITISNGSGVSGNPTISTNITSYISLSPYIVGSDANSGFSTITTAIAQAVSDGVSASNPKNIYIKPKNGGYTENLTLVDGINLIGFGSSFFSGVCTTKIIGKITMTVTGNASVNNLVLQTNGDYVVEVTGSNVLNVILNNCYINATNANAIHCTNANAGVQLFGCQGNCSTNTYFIATGGSQNVYNCTLAGVTTTASTIANASLSINYSVFNAPITTSGTGSIALYYSQIINTNTTCLTHGGSGSSVVIGCRFESGSASAISIGATLAVMQSSVFSTNTNAITGAGTLQYALIAFYGSSASSSVNTSTLTPLATLI